MLPMLIPPSGATAFWNDAGRFFSELFDGIASGLIFFGTPLDIVLAIADILVTTMVVYLVLRLMRDSRAWQLVKGIGLILVFAGLCVLLGLSTVGFLLGNTLSVLAIAFVVLFQPELRRALETVGRGSFSFLAGALVEEGPQSSRSVHNTIEAIVRACDRMSQTRTGALIVIERESRMGELAEQENAVILDSAVSSTMLLQIFYKGSPLHDGAALIRSGRILAARCHIPLSDNLHIRRDFGTRHRAAVGASEMGDAIAVVVSEERGTISVGFEGRLYAMESPDALRILLHKLLGPKQPGMISSLLRGRGTHAAAAPDPAHVAAADAVEAGGAGAGDDGRAEAPGVPDAFGRVRPGHDAAASRPAYRFRFLRGRQLLTLLVSFLIACLLWFYVQVTTNPVETRVYNVGLRTVHAEALEKHALTIESSTGTVAVTVMGRRKNLDALSSDAIDASADMTGFVTAGTHMVSVEASIDAKARFRITAIAPASATVTLAGPG
jgi:diadenylate cyclase